MSWIFIIIFAALMAGFVQGVTGFGSGIVMMIFLPHLLPINQSAGVSTLTMVIANVMLVWKYRKHLDWQKIIAPFLIYACMALSSLYLSSFFASNHLKILLGLLLIVLSIYYAVMNIRSISIKAIPLWIMVIFSLISGFFNGMFGIGGPLMALYFLTNSKSKENYLSNIQTFFLMDTFLMTTVRFSSGILTFSNLKYIAVGIVGAVLDTILANHLVGHLNIKLMKLFIYIFIGLSGLYYLISSI
ncbi:sulfite exporter TauE/SafE family protein [Companilactobacillus halodurans]|uniref:Probable membrane transporter protein n=1 Tax=Companilactobacillus halodurans TaxID=2584183 RepID=A0A5P0ZZP6_9LACO|nr:sulfite exporter TauE/SafE family protein [Companilactobacillus halodurans]MQS75209.1 sulfite exporter TauE/SafE family protein [Companilactobacillus halodurans]MQS98529.1 sulfite exporter TauE/SafE family protein [Companilactobacillus halodurans]